MLKNSNIDSAMFHSLFNYSGKQHVIILDIYHFLETYSSGYISAIVRIRNNTCKLTTTGISADIFKYFSAVSQKDVCDCRIAVDMHC